MDDLRVHSAYKKAVPGQFSCYRFIVAAATLHDNASFTIQFSDKFLKRLEIGGQAGNIKEFWNNRSTRKEERYSAFAFGDINTLLRSYS